ncbi:MAG: EAL domain-containing protein [Oscillospiraceae bacterium]|nr:EAL domain-containing protein [Oscillospiraceae bacterium]
MTAVRSWPKRTGALLLCAVLTAVLLAPLGFRVAAAGRRIVRVGWFDSTFNRKDEGGRRTGYAYEYQQKIAAYTGWTYEYVEGSWPELMTKLENGEIDLLSDVSYTPDREGKFLYSAEPMGTEVYYLFISTANQAITADDLSTINGKRVGVMRGSVQEELLLQWAEERGLGIDLVELTSLADDSVDMLTSGELDALVTLDGLGVTKPCVPVCKIGGSDFYFAVNKDRSDLLLELNDAMGRILEENRYYNQQLFDKYVLTYGSSAFLSPGELEWYEAHKPIRVGFCADYLPFCAEEDGELVGALAGYLSMVKDSIKNTVVFFTPVSYPSAEAALDALRAGEVDCVFPVNLSPYDGEQFGILTTSPLDQAEIYAVQRRTDYSALSVDAAITVAMEQGNINYEVFLQDNFPNWKLTYFPTAADCFRALDEGEASCVLVNSYRLNYEEKLMKKYDFYSIPTGRAVSFSFAVRQQDVRLYSILNKTVSLIPKASMEAALLAQTPPQERITLADFLRDNWLRAIIVAAIVIGILVLLLFQRMKAGKTAEEKQRLIAATERDSLTGLYNRSFFFEYADQLYRNHPEEHLELLMLNVDNFHTVNAMNGREQGNTVLRLLGGAVRDYMKTTKGIASRIEADCFVLYCLHKEDYETVLEGFQKQLNRFSSGVRIRMGVMPWVRDVEPNQMIERARTACGLARNKFKPHLVVFDERVHQRELYEQRLLNDLERAVRDGQFQVYYQPKYAIQCEPSRVAAAEALVRWHHPELGLIKPSDFIPLLERSGRVGVVDRFVWREAARQIAAWRDAYGAVLPVSVNLSRVDIFDPGLIDNFEALISENRLEHAALRLEVTETAYTENADHVIQVVKTLREKGYSIEMDDFGAGYSSLSMLSDLPIDLLKMDREFVRNIGRNEKDNRLVALVLDIARSLKVPVVAEGVETEEQLAYLKSLGCSLVQGFFFSQALPPEEFERLAFGA